MGAAAQEQRYEHGLPGRRAQGVAEQGPVQLDVAEADVEAGAELADPLEEGEDGVRGAGVAAAVGHGDEGGLHGRAPWGRARGGRRPLSWAPSWSVIRVSSSAAPPKGEGEGVREGAPAPS